MQIVLVPLQDSQHHILANQLPMSIGLINKR